MNGVLSDYNSSRSSNISRKNVYSDISNSFTLHPIYNDLLPILDLDSIKQSLKNLILTNQYDRLFQPEIATNVSALLFENADMFTEYELKTKIETVIDKYEPRISKYIVTVKDEADKNAYRVSIVFQVTFDTSAEIIIFLTRIR